MAKMPQSRFSFLFLFVSFDFFLFWPFAAEERVLEVEDVSWLVVVNETLGLGHVHFLVEISL
jgi:hypothetical protein